jgi:hypothetical protein
VSNTLISAAYIWNILGVNIMYHYSSVQWDGLPLQH